MSIKNNKAIIIFGVLLISIVLYQQYRIYEITNIQHDADSKAVEFENEKKIIELKKESDLEILKEKQRLQEEDRRNKKYEEFYKACIDGYNSMMDWFAKNCAYDNPQLCKDNYDKNLFEQYGTSDIESSHKKCAEKKYLDMYGEAPNL